MISRGESKRGYGFEIDIEPTRIITVSAVPKQMFNQYTLTTCQSGYATKINSVPIIISDKLGMVCCRTTI